jgi:dihydroorotate dehydrogenase electron transfer subunit
MVKAADGHEPLLRRPFSVFEILNNGAGAPIGFSLLNKRIGPSTARLYEARTGDRISVLGPLGRPFTPVAPPAAAWMVAGGVGLAPFATLASALINAGIETTLFYGARSAAELFYVDWFLDLGVTMVLATEDGSRGERGRVIAPLEEALSGRSSADPVTLYACGPEGMLAATAKVAARFGRPCQVSVERTMGCGMGGCYSCVVPMLDADGRRHHVRSCLAGPVLDADRICWE